MNDVKERIRRSTILSVIVFVVIILFFLGVIIAYYAMLYSETRERVMKSGQLCAEEAAEQIEKYLNTGIDTLTLASYTFDKMIRDKSSYETIDTFLVNQSTAIENITSGYSTGLYAYINDIYMDGTDWVPDDDFIPTERPWYIAAMESDGQVAIVDPYLDAQTKTIMITLCKTLCDGDSVLAMDFSLDYLQKLTENLSTTGGTDMEIVLDGDYNVITHSDPSEVGKRYIDNDGSFGYTLVYNLKQAEEGYCSFTYENRDYIVYVKDVANDWHCLSIIDATYDFGQLQNMLGFTIIAAILVVLIQVLIMIRLNKKNTREMLLNEEKQRAVAASEAKSTFLSNMSHEIRTPINAMLGMNEMILRESEDKNVREYAQNIHAAGDTLLGLVNDILDFSKIEAGKMEIIPVEYDISYMIADLVNMVRTRAEDKGLHFVTEIDENIPKILFGDEVRIKQAVTNILSNAVKYTEKGSVTIRIDYRGINFDKENIMLCFSVKDTGIGIKQEDMEKLFTEFERIDEKRNRNVEGTGLGMNITMRLLKMMGSELKVESVYGEGSEFRLEIKQKVVKWEPLGNYETAYHEAISKRKRYREKFKAPNAHILVTDDTRINLTVFRNLLKSTEVQVDTAISGADALILLQDKKYDVVFLDHMMPEPDGVQTLHILREDRENKNRNVPVICLTANAISGSRETYISLGFDDYLSKPIESDKLEDMLIKYLPKEKVCLVTDDSEESVKDSASEYDISVLPEWIQKCKGIDPVEGVKNCAGPREFQNVLKGFYETIDDMADEIEGYLKDSDINGYTIKVHGLKSLARIIGASELSNRAALLEKAGKEEDMDYINANTEETLLLLKSYKENLSPVSEGNGSEKLPDIPEKTLKEAYAALLEFAEVQDYDCFNMVLDSLRKYKLPSDDKKRIDEIEKYNQKIDWEGIRKLL